MSSCIVTMEKGTEDWSKARNPSLGFSLSLISASLCRLASLCLSSEVLAESLKGEEDGHGEQHPKLTSPPLHNQWETLPSGST